METGTFPFKSLNFVISLRPPLYITVIIIVFIEHDLIAISKVYGCLMF